MKREEKSSNRGTISTFQKAGAAAVIFLISGVAYATLKYFSNPHGNAMEKNTWNQFARANARRNIPIPPLNLGGIDNNLPPDTNGKLAWPLENEIREINVLTAKRELRILVVEDNALFKMSTARILESFGHQVTVTDNVSEVAELASQFDVILMDHDLGVDKDGLDLTKEIRNRHCDIPIILHSTNSEEHWPQYKDADAQGFVIKGRSSPRDYQAVLDSIKLSCVSH